MAPVTRGAASEVPVWRETPPWPSETRMSSPGATRKWFFSLSQAPDAASFRQASPGVLEKFEMVPSRPTEPTTSRLGLVLKFQLMFEGWETPSLPAATTRMEYLELPEARAVFQPGLRVQPGSPSEALITPRFAPDGAILSGPPRSTTRESANVSVVEARPVKPFRAVARLSFLPLPLVK